MPERHNGSDSEEAAEVAALEGKPRPTYWVQVFSEQTWREFLDAGGKVTGFREKRWPIVRKIRPGDCLLCYISKVGIWIAALEATSEPYIDNSSSVWKDFFPCRVDVSVMVKLQQSCAVPIRELRTLSIFNSQHWGTHFMGSPSKFSVGDAAVVLRELKRAETSSQDKSPH